MTAGRHLDLTGKTALVTGAARGLGRAIALRLAENGARVFVAGRDEAALRVVGGDTQPLVFDLDDSRACEAALSEVGAISFLATTLRLSRCMAAPMSRATAVLRHGRRLGV